MAKIIADLKLLIDESWDIELIEKLRKAFNILDDNEDLEGYDR